MSRLNAFTDFKPNFAALGFGWMPNAFEDVFREGTEKLMELLVQNQDTVVFVEGLFDAASVQGALKFGHLTDSNIPDAQHLTQIVPYRLTSVFDANGSLVSVKLTLFFLNPRVILSEDDFIPSNVSPDGSVTPLDSKPVPCGLLLAANAPPEPSTLPEKTFDDQIDTLIGRFDIWIEWTIDDHGNSNDLFGRAKGVSGVYVPNGQTLKMFSPGFANLDLSFRHVHLPLCLQLVDSTVDFIMKAKELPALLMSEFNLREDFRGFYFNNLKFHWLNDSDVGQSNWPEIILSSAAISFDTGSSNIAKWYAAFEAKINDASSTGDYLSLIKDARINVMLSENRLQSATVSGIFTELPFPYSWLSGKRAVISMKEESWKDERGETKKSPLITLGLESVGEGVLATPLTEKSSKQLKLLATGLALAPLLASGAKAVSVASQEDRITNKNRGYFSPIGEKKSLDELYLAAATGWFLTEAVSLEQLRVTGVKLQRQLARVNDSKAEAGKYQTALLMDYEADYTIGLGDKIGIKTKRSITTRVEGTGFSKVEDGYQWVQVPSGTRELSIADPALWELGKLDNFLKISSLSIRTANGKQLVIRLRLMGNLDVLTSADFVIAVPLDADSEPTIEAFPSEITIDIPGGVKGTGTLVISEKTVTGGLDLVFPSGFRLYGAVRVTREKGPDGNQVTATIFSAGVTFSTPIPVLGTGLGWTGIEGIVATHYKRGEKSSTGSISPALNWLKEVKGNVVKSIEIDKAWDVEYDRSSIGLGVTIELMASGSLLNVNGLLLIEGKRQIIFINAKLLEPPINNEDAANKDLQKGIIGALDINPEKNEISLSALANLKYKDFLTIKTPLILFFDTKNSKNNHLYLGTVKNRANAKLSLFNAINITAAGYFMAAGHDIEDVPFGRGQKKRLGGFAIATGAGAYVSIGNKDVYAKGSIETYLNLSFADGLYANGTAFLPGKLRLFFVTLGASAKSELEYSKPNGGTEKFYAKVEACGHYKDFFFDLKGCFSFTYGTRIEEPTIYPPLTERVSFLSGANVALRGQGRFGNIDAVIPDEDSNHQNIPLDAVIAISMIKPPKIVKVTAEGFAKSANSLNQNDTSFYIGKNKGEYTLTSVLLQKKNKGGDWEDVVYEKYPARWWASGQSTNGGHLSSVTLALMTRNPLAAANAVSSVAQLEAWLDAVLGSDDICQESVEPQQCLYTLKPYDVGVPEDGKWELEAILKSPEIESKIGRAGATASILEIEPRYINHYDPIPGYPKYPAHCIVESINEPVPALSFYSQWIENIITQSEVKIIGNIDTNSFIDLLIAYANINLNPLKFALINNDSSVIPIDNSLVDQQDLTTEAVQTNFHNNESNWKPITTAFANLKKLSHYQHYKFVVIRINLPSLKLTKVPKALAIKFNNDYNQQIPAILGGYRFIPFEESIRFKNDKEHRYSVIDNLKNFINPQSIQAQDSIPLLDPASDYQLSVFWESEFGSRGSKGSKIVEFRTTDKPPASALPYLLATFPQAEEKFHSAEDSIGFSLGSRDALAILAKFDGIKLKVTITDDGGSEVFSPGLELRWNKGVDVEPAALMDSANLPLGFISESIASLPSAQRNALLERIHKHRNQTLGCIETPEDTGGLWIGFDVALKPLSRYRVLVEVIDSNTPSKWNVKSIEVPGPFLEWRFSTGIHRTHTEHVELLNSLPIRHKMLIKDLPKFDADQELQEIQNKDLEDALHISTGERLNRSGEARVTVLWKEITTSDLKAHAVLVESNEPLLRKTKSVRIGLLSEQYPDSLIAEPTDFLLQSFNTKASQRVDRIVYSTSGFSALIFLKENSKDSLKLKLARYEVSRIPIIKEDTDESSSTFHIPEASLIRKINI